MKASLLVLVTAMLAVAAVAAIPTASAYRMMGACYGQYDTGSNATSNADDYCTGAWSDAGIECVGIYFPNSNPPMCIGVEPKGGTFIGTATTAEIGTADPGLPLGAFGGDPLAG